MDDLISRQAAIDAMNVINDSICEQQAIDALCGLPSAERHGRWARGDEMADYPRVPYKPWETYCSCCGEIMEQSHDNFCGNCGAKMDEVDNENTEP